jgi:hypothetical protein
LRFRALVVVLLFAFASLQISWISHATSGEFVYYSLPENLLEMDYDQEKIDQWMRANASLVLEQFEKHFSDKNSEQSRAAVSYWVDVKIVYDNNANNFAIQRWQWPPIYFTAMTWNALHIGFGQFWPDMDFYVGLDPNWCVHDTVGVQGSWSTLHDLLFLWSTQSYGWPSPSSSWTTRGTTLAPAGTGHGSYFDLLVMFVVEPSHWGTLGVTWLKHNAILINLFSIVLWSSWGSDLLPGLLSIIMHEAGHDYSAVGDTTGSRMDVMDYFWSLLRPSSSLFDLGHQNDIGPWRYKHSA